MSDKIMKKAADELLKIADEIEKEAAEVTQFVCGKCSHTATLAAINTKRQAAAKEAGENVTVSDITVNDSIQCPACDGIMAYKATEASEAYYFDPDKKAEEKKPEEEPKKEEVEAKKDPDAPHSEKTETPAEESQESLETQKKEREKGVHASIDYDSLQRYTA
jgi:hypothetical protein